MTTPDRTALDRAVEEAWDDFENALRDNFNLYPTPGRREKCRAALESAITARVVAQEQARRAKLVAALEHIERRADQWRECQDVATAALAADREPSDPLREGR